MAARSPQVLLAVASFNEPVTSRLYEGAKKTLEEEGITSIEKIVVHGSWEIPCALKIKLSQKSYDFCVALGAIIKGETEHHFFLSQAVFSGLMKLALETGTPIGLGILTVEKATQAYERAGGKKGNYGANAAKAAYALWKETKG